MSLLSYCEGTVVLWSAWFFYHYLRLDSCTWVLAVFFAANPSSWGHEHTSTMTMTMTRMIILHQYRTMALFVWTQIRNDDEDDDNTSICRCVLLYQASFVWTQIHDDDEDDNTTGMALCSLYQAFLDDYDYDDANCPRLLLVHTTTTMVILRSLSWLHQILLVNTNTRDDEDEDDNTAVVVFTAQRFFLVTQIHDNEDDNTRMITLWSLCLLHQTSLC